VLSCAGSEEAMSEANLPTQQPQAGQAPRLSPPDVDARRAGNSQGTAAQRSTPPGRLIWRVERRETLQALRKAPRWRAGSISVSWVPAGAAEPPRVAFAIGRRAGSAVVRNRLRRRLRALVRDAAPRLRPGAYLISAGPSAAALNCNDLRSTLEKAFSQVKSQ
jgi:ribonuclease P protein component